MQPDEGLLPAYGHVVRRLLGLALVAIVVEHVATPGGDLGSTRRHGPVGSDARAAQGDWFQTLMHIAVTSLWILPVIRAAPACASPI